jgi:hypothetical protein
VPFVVLRQIFNWFCPVLLLLLLLSFFSTFVMYAESKDSAPFIKYPLPSLNENKTLKGKFMHQNSTHHDIGALLALTSRYRLPQCSP